MSRMPEPPLPPRLPGSLGDSAELPMSPESSWEALELRADLASRALEGLDIAECRFAGANLTSAVFDDCRVRDSLLVDCEASGVDLEAVSLSRVVFRRCRLTGAILSRGRLRDVRFVECQLRDVQLRVAEGTRVRFESCDMTGADLYASKLEQCCFFDCDLTRADFSQAVVRGARLHGSRLEELRGVSSLVGVVVSSSQMVPLGLQLLATHEVEVDDGDSDDDPVALGTGSRHKARRR